MNERRVDLYRLQGGTAIATMMLVNSRVSTPGSFTSPKIVGILNVTEDSFSDGGAYLAPVDAIDRARWLADNGADLIEIGAASSHPDARSVSPSEEIRRVDSVLCAVKSLGLPVVLDSCSPETQRFALSAEVEYFNDVTGFADASMHTEFAASTCRLVVMNSHRAQDRATRERPAAPVDAKFVAEALEGRVNVLNAAGIPSTRIIVDPGMGFFLSSEAAASFAVLRDLRQLDQSLEPPMMVSVSRKSFLRAAAQCEVDQAGSATLAAEVYCAIAGIAYIRTHDVKALRHAFRVLESISGEPSK